MTSLLRHNEPTYIFDSPPQNSNNAQTISFDEQQACDYGKESRTCQIKFIDALRHIMQNGEFQVAIHTGIKNETHAHRLCNFYQKLADREPMAAQLYCYVDYMNLKMPLDIKQYQVRLCHWGKVAKMRADIVETMIRSTLDGKDVLVLYESYDQQFLTKLGTIIKDILKVYKLRIASRFFNQYGPEKTFYVLSIDVNEELQKSHDFDN